MPQKDNIHVLHLSTNTNWRGGEQQVAYLLEELKAKGVQQTVVGRKNSAMEKYCKENGFNYEGYNRRSSIDVSFAYKLYKYYKKHDVDIIHTHDSHGHSFAVLADSLFGGSPPIVVSRRVSFPVSKSVFSKFKYNYLKIKRIICSSEAVKQITAPSIRDKDALEVVYDGVDLDRFKNIEVKNTLRKEFNIPDEVKLIGNIATLTTEKDYYTFIDTAAICIAEGIKAKFIAIGDGSEETELRQYANQKGIAEHVIFAGYRTNALELLPELDLFLTTPTQEGLGTSILDAMACGVPVVATNAGGVPESVKHMDTGWLSNIKDAKHLAEGVRTLLSEKDIGNKLTANAKVNLQSFSKQAMAEGVYSIYNQL